MGISVTASFETLIAGIVTRLNTPGSISCPNSSPASKGLPVRLSTLKKLASEEVETESGSPLRGQLLGLEALEARARELAARFTLARNPDRGTRRFFRRF